MQITKHQHVVPRQEGQWAVKVADGEKATKIFPDREEAIEYAKELSRKHNVCMVVHDETGKFEEFKCNPELLEEGAEGEECMPGKDKMQWTEMPESNMNESDMHESDNMEWVEPVNPNPDQHVIKKDNKWAVITEGENVERIFKNKGYAMVYAYQVAMKMKSCMITHDKDGNLKSRTCPPNESPGIIEVIRMNTKM